jgi:hypothetical protein
VGELFLYPYCYKPDAPKDLEDFRAMGAAFTGAQGEKHYTLKQSRAWYAILGDHDDWLYDTLGTLATTVEVSRPLAGVGANPLRLAYPMCWMNPRDPDETVERAAAPCLHALAAGMRRVAARTAQGA